MNGYDFDLAFQELINWESSFHSSVSLSETSSPVDSIKTPSTVLSLHQNKKMRLMTPEPSPTSKLLSVDATTPMTMSIPIGIPSPEKDASSTTVSQTTTPALDWIALPPPATACSDKIVNKSPQKDRKRKRETGVKANLSLVSRSLPSLQTEYILSDTGKGIIKRTSYTLETITKMHGGERYHPQKKLCIIPDTQVFDKKQFLQTIRNGESDMFKMLLKKFESSIALKDKQDAVLEASIYGNDAIIEYLFKDSKQVFTHRVLGDAMHQAKRSKHDKAAILLKSIFEQKVAERSLLLRATRDKDIQRIQSLLLDKDSMISSYEIEKALQAACRLDDSSVFYYILSICYREVSSNVLDQCLIKAIEQQRIDLMLRLLPFASMISDTIKGQCLRQCFVTLGFSPATQLILTMFGDKLPSEEKAWVLRRASETGNLATILEMETLGIATEDIGTFVKLATSHGHASIVEHLLDRYGLLVSLTDKKWSLEVAFRKGFVNIYTTINASIKSFRHE